MKALIKNHRSTTVKMNQKNLVKPQSLKDRAKHFKKYAGLIKLKLIYGKCRKPGILPIKDI